MEDPKLFSVDVKYTIFQKEQEVEKRETLIFEISELTQFYNQYKGRVYLEDFLKRYLKSLTKSSISIESVSQIHPIS